MKFFLIIFIFISSCNVYEVIGEDTEISSEFSSIIQNTPLELANLQHPGPSTVNFPTTSPGIDSNISISIFNNGFTEATTVTISTSSADFNIVSNGCGTNIPSFVTCNIDLVFNNASNGNFTGSLNIDYFNGDTTKTLIINLNVDVVAIAMFSISESDPYNFGSISIGTSVNHIFTLTNIGTGTGIILNAFALIAPFSYAGGTFPGLAGSCGSTLVAGSSCTFEVEFFPTVLGNYNDVIQIDYDDGNGGTAFVNRSIIGEGL